jgi:hypothetical protein
MTLSVDDYAVPAKRALRIHDASAERFAWDHVHATKGLTPDERKEARRRIVERAQELGLDTEGGRGQAKASDRLERNVSQHYARRRAPQQDAVSRVMTRNW